MASLNFLNRLNLDPIIKTKVTTYLEPFVDAQKYENCGDFVMRLGDCLEAYGVHKGKTVCQDFISDYNECMTMGKSKQRVLLMRKERQRQFKAGEREKCWADPPADDAY